MRSGRVKKAEAEALKKILSSFRFTNNKEDAYTQQINVAQPLPNSEITSPLRIKGRARGNWYFEGSFSVVLYNAADEQLTKSVVKADGNWMTEEWVPFDATLRFTAPNNERGRLVFRKANPSGLKENAALYSVPVIFPEQ